MRHWLPFLQLLVSLFLKTFPDPFALRFFLALIAGLTCGSSYLLGQRLFGHKTGVVVGASLTFNPLFVCWSIVPYQEALFLMLIFQGLFFYLFEKPTLKYLGAILVSLSCLVRYEGWILSGILIFDQTIVKKSNPKGVYYSACFLIGIVTWLFIKHVLQVDSVIGGPLNGEVLNKKLEVLLSSGLPNIIQATWSTSITSIYHFATLFGLPALCFALMGLALMVKEKFDLKIHFFGYGLLLCALTSIRGLGGAFTERMFILPGSLMFFPMAFFFASKLTKEDRKTCNISWDLLAVLAVAVVFAPTAFYKVQGISSLFDQEYRVVKLIETLEPRGNVLIYPREISNTWGESAISAVIGNSVKLIINENVFSFDMLLPANRTEVDRFIREQKIKYIIRYSDENYHLTTL